MSGETLQSKTKEKQVDTNPRGRAHLAPPAVQLNQIALALLLRQALNDAGVAVGVTEAKKEKKGGRRGGGGVRARDFFFIVEKRVGWGREGDVFRPYRKGPGTALGSACARCDLGRGQNTWEAHNSVKSSSSKSNQVKPNQIESNQIKSNQRTDKSFQQIATNAGRGVALLRRMNNNAQEKSGGGACAAIPYILDGSGLQRRPSGRYR